MSNLTSQKRKCPRCGAEKFYVGAETGTLVFFHVCADGTPFSVDPPHAMLPDSDIGTIHCISCSWAGTADQLKPAE